MLEKGVAGSPAAASANKLGPFDLAPGISGRNVSSLLVASYFSIGLLNQVGTLRAYLFNEMLDVPAGQQGRLVSVLETVAELYSIVLAALVGAASDRLGRRTIYAAGFAFLAFAFLVFPHTAVGPSLIIATLIAATGATCIATMLSAVIADYPAERARGRLVGICFFLNGMGVASLVGLLLSMPAKYRAAGADSFAAGLYSYWTVAALCLIPLLFVAFGLARNGSRDESERLGFLATVRSGFAAARDVRVLLAYVSAAVSRASLSIVSGFFSLWMARAGSAQGMSTAEALAAGSKYFITIQVTATLWAVLVIFFIDRYDRVLALAVAAALACASYTTIGLVDNPFQPWMYAAAVFMGIGEMSGVLASQALIGQVAPPKVRGAAIGVFTLFGSLGILLAAIVGGYLFDTWRYSAPYFVMGVSSGVLCLLAILVYMRTNARGKSREPELAS